MRKHLGVLASVGLAAALAVVPRTTAGTRVFTAVASPGSRATRPVVMRQATLFGSVWTDHTRPVESDDRRFAEEVSRGAVRTPTTPKPVTTVKAAVTPTTVRAVRPTSTVKPVTTTTAHRPATTTTTAAPRGPPPAATDEYHPYPECMQRAHWANPSWDEMVRCWDPLVRRWSWPSIGKVFHVMWCESKGNPWAGPNHPYHGLMQLGPGGPFDPWQNMAGAWSKSRRGTNWSQWECV